MTCNCRIRNLALAVVVLVLLCIPRQLLGQTFTFTTFDAPAAGALPFLGTVPTSINSSNVIL